MRLPSYWSALQLTSAGWVHPDDEATLSREPHSFNLNFPPPVFVGDITSAKVIVLAANGGYDPVITPGEFKAPGAVEEYLHRLANPSLANWSDVAPYYGNINYAQLLFSGAVAIVNACAYRSHKISQEPDNKRVIAKLPSVRKNREWLVSTVLPRADAGECLIVGKRCGLWSLPASVKRSVGYIADPAPVSPHLSKVVFARVREVLGNA